MAAKFGILSGSTDGQGVLIAAIISPGDIIHTSSAVSGEIDRVVLTATNNDTVARDITLEWGEATVTKVIKQTIPALSGEVLLTLAKGKTISNGGIVKGFASVANKIVIGGHIVRALDEDTF